MAPGNVTEGVQPGPLTMGSGDLNPGDAGLLLGFMSLGICCKATNSQASMYADMATQVGGLPLNWGCEVCESPDPPAWFPIWSSSKRWVVLLLKWIEHAQTRH